MIPKKIHFCWLGSNEYPERVRSCMKSWRRVLGDYELVRWDETRFDTNSVPWVREAVERRKYAFASDYIRHYALYTEGGIYLDTDVEILKRFDDLLNAEMFAVIETEERILAENIARGRISEEGRLLTDGILPDSGLGLQSGVFGSVAGHPFSKRCLEWYESHRFILDDGSLYDRVIAPDIMAYNAIPAGFSYRDEMQNLSEGIRIYPSPTIAAYPAKTCPESRAIHHCLGSWRDGQSHTPSPKRWYSRWWKCAMRRLGLHK